MGAILAVVGDLPEDELDARIGRMAERSPHRGAVSKIVGPGFAIAVQNVGWDASLARSADRVVAVHGYFGDSEGFDSAVYSGRSNPTSAEWVLGAGWTLDKPPFSRMSGEAAVVMIALPAAELVMARDVAGCKPLFFNASDGVTTVATEIRQVLAGTGSSAQLNTSALARYIAIVNHSDLESVYEGILRVPPGTVSVVDPSGQRVQPFWQPPETDSDLRPASEYVDELDEILARAVRRATQGVSCTVALSGGLDSAAIWGSMLNPARTAADQDQGHSAVSLSYPGMSCDETGRIEALHKELRSTGRFIDASEFRPLEDVEQRMKFMDSPCHPMALQMFMLSAAAREMGADVVITGIGGDEFLGGSPESLVESAFTGRWLRLLNDLWSWPDSHGGRGRVARRLVRRVASELLGREPQNPRLAWLGREYRSAARVAFEAYQGRLSSESFSRRPFVGMLGLLQSGAMHESLEQIAAGHGLELRLPLLHRELIDFSFRIPPRIRVGKEGNKRLLREVTARMAPGHVDRCARKTVFGEILDREYRMISKELDMDNWLLVRKGILDSTSLDDLMSSIKDRTVGRVFAEITLLEIQMKCLFRE